MSNYNTTLQNNNAELLSVLGILEGFPDKKTNRFQNITITENGVYTADDEYDGLGSVTVDIKGGEIDHTAEDGLIARSLTTYTNSRITKLREYAFRGDIGIESVSFPKCSTIENGAFEGCWYLTSTSFPKCTTIGNGAFFNCVRLESVNFPKCTSIGSCAFQECESLVSAVFPNCVSIGNDAFFYCLTLYTLILKASSVAVLDDTVAFWFTPIDDGYGAIYVPASLVSAYKSATNWATYASQIFPIEESLIRFTINGTSYQAEIGMTWGEWINSEYNTEDFHLGLIVGDFEITEDTLVVEGGNYEAEKKGG